MAESRRNRMSRGSMQGGCLGSGQAGRCNVQGVENYLGASELSQWLCGTVGKLSFPQNRYITLVIVPHVYRNLSHLGGTNIHSVVLKIIHEASTRLNEPQ